MSEPVLSCNGISKSFKKFVVPSKHLQDRILRWRKHRKRWSVQALNNVSLQLHKGEWLGISGPNGSGKTTLMCILANLMRPDEGTVVRTEHVACFFGLGAGFNPEHSAVQNIASHFLMYRAAEDLDVLSDRIIDFAGLRSHADLPLKCYSTGMQQRLAFAAVAHTEAPIYLFDEFFAVGDTDFRKLCLSHFQSLKSKGASVILVGHNVQELQDICDRFLWMEDGSIIRKEHYTLPKEKTRDATAQLRSLVHES